MIGSYSGTYGGIWDALNVFANPAASIAQALNAPPAVIAVLSPTQTLVGERDVMTQNFQQNRGTLDKLTGGLDRKTPKGGGRKGEWASAWAKVRSFRRAPEIASSGKRSGGNVVGSSSAPVSTAVKGGQGWTVMPRGGPPATGGTSSLVTGIAAVLALGLIGGAIYLFATRKRRRR